MALLLPLSLPNPPRSGPAWGPQPRGLAVLTPLLGVRLRAPALASLVAVWPRPSCHTAVTPCVELVL